MQASQVSANITLAVLRGVPRVASSGLGSWGLTLACHLGGFVG